MKLRLFSMKSLGLLLACSFLNYVIAQTPASAPYFTSFESGVLDAAWSTYTQTSNCEVAIYNNGVYTWSGSTANANTGTKFLGLHNAIGGAFETTHAALHLDLVGESGLRLSFYLSEWNEEDHPEDGIFISDDGGLTYTEVFHYNGTLYTDLQYTHFDWSLDSINALHGLSFNSDYVIKVQQHDNFYFAGGNDGFLLDDVDVYANCRTYSFQSVFSCGTYTVPSGDETYVGTSTMSVMDTILNAAGCDSILNIDIVPGNSSATAYEFSCLGSFTAPDGQVLTTSGQFDITIPNNAGCDSLITLYLVVGSPSASHISETACGSYTAPDGQVYTSSGNYSAVIPNHVGCDSSISINLTVTPNSSSSETVVSCEPYLWSDGNTYNTTGMYTQTFAAANGCDSIVTLDLTMDTNPSVTILSNDEVTLEGQGANDYQWIDCGSMTVVGSGANFTPTANGEYAAVGSVGPYCSDTSDCYTVSILSIEDENSVVYNLYPNPAKDYFEIASDTPVKSISVYTLDGRLVTTSNTQKVEVSELAKSTYLVQIEFEGNVIVRDKLVIE